MVALERLLPRAPAPLIAVASGIAASGMLALSARGVETIGRIPSGLPLPVLPDTSLFQTLWPGALGIALMCFTESIASGRAFARPGDRRPDADQELLALGVGNLLGGLFGAMPAGGGTSQTAVNAGAGARSQVSSLVTAIATLLVIVFLAPLIALMPQATLAAVVIVTSVGLINPADLMAIRRVRTIEFRWALAAMLGVVVLGTLQGILAAVILSLVSLLRQANHPAVYVLGQKPGTDVFRPRMPEHPEDRTWAGVLLLRPEGRIYFANAQRIVDGVMALVHDAGARAVVLDLSAVPDIEYTGLKSMTELERSLADAGVVLSVAALNPPALAVIQRSSLGARLGRERMFFTIAQAVAYAGRQTAV
jgi:MFS superfamily sulfate permease-like transporter